MEAKGTHWLERCDISNYSLRSKKGRVRNSEESLWEFWDTVKERIFVMPISKGEDKVTVIKFKAIMSENFPNMEKHIQVQETPRTPNKLNLRGELKHHNLCTKSQRKLQSHQEKGSYIKSPHKISKEFLIRGKARGEWDDIIFQE